MWAHRMVVVAALLDGGLAGCNSTDGSHLARSRPTAPLLTPQNIPVSTIAGPSDAMPPIATPTSVSVCDPGVCQGRYEVGLNKATTIELQKNAGISPADGKFTSVTKERIIDVLKCGIVKEGACTKSIKDTRSPDITSSDDVCLKRLHDGIIGPECNY